MKKIRNFTILLFITFGILFSNSFAASFEFNPANQTYPAGCQKTLNIDIDATGQDSNAADIEVHYNPSIITILDSDPNIPGMQIKTGNAYEFYFGNQVDSVNGIIRLAGGSFISNLTTKKVFASINFTSISTATSATFTIKFDGAGATLDSNIADASTSDDLLTSVIDGTYTFNTGSCVADVLPPVADFNNPIANQTNYIPNSDVLIRVTDNMSGTDLNTLIIYINGEPYISSDSDVIVSGNPLNYLFTISPRISIPTDRASLIRIRGNDNAGNKFDQEIIFNIPTITSTPSPSTTPVPTSTPAPTSTLTPTQTPLVCPGNITTPGDNVISNSITNIVGSLADKPVIESIGLPENTVKDIQNTAESTFIAVNAAEGVGLLAYLGQLLKSGLFIPFFLLGKKKNRYGRVYDENSKKGIPFATINLYEYDGNRFVTSTVSDINGSYSILIPDEKRNYYITVKHTEYNSIELVHEKLSSYHDFYSMYRGGIFTAQNEISLMIPLKRRELTLDQKIIILLKKIPRAGYYVIDRFLIILTIISVVYSIVTYNIIGIIFSVVYLTLYFFIYYRKILFKKTYGTVKESYKGGYYPSANAFVGIFKDGKQITDTLITDETGKYKALLNKGDYRIEINKNGYEVEEALGDTEIQPPTSVIYHVNEDSLGTDVYLKESDDDIKTSTESVNNPEIIQ
ncbi:MAG: hypothetical protein WCJ19_05080 [bacterium]